MSIGIGGSGRASVTKLAAFMSDYELFQIEITKTYTFTDWREDLKKMLRKAGFDGASTVFLFGDHQLKVSFQLRWRKKFLKMVSLYSNPVTRVPGAHPSFNSMKQLGVLIPFLGWDASWSQGYIQTFPEASHSWFTAAHSYSWMERGIMRVNWLAQEHNTGLELSTQSPVL